MMREYPEFQTKVSGALLVSRGNIQPRPLNSSYRVRIEYRMGNAPQVWVEEPQLEQRNPDEPIPHTYPGNRPCLYLPGNNEWSSDKYIADTIVPWLSLWLFFYEGWLATGKWHGGGVHPPSASNDPQPQQIQNS
jgi:hypothetical protein